VKENKTKPAKTSVASFIAALPEREKRIDAKTLVKLMQSATGDKPKMWGPSIVGFGSYHYVYDSGREGEMPVVGFSPRKGAIVLYNMGAFADSANLFAKLGKYTTGKSCVYVKKLADIDQQVLQTLLAKSVEATRGRYPA